MLNAPGSSAVAPAKRPAALGLLCFALFAALGARFVSGIDASGDEVHYLVMAQSLWREGDLDLRDNYAREEWREYRSGPTTPHYAASRIDGTPFPGHSPGLPFLLAPVYAAFGRLGAVLFFAALAGVIAALLARASILAAIIGVGPPLAAYVFHLYTELPAALLILIGLLSLRSVDSGRSRLDIRLDLGPVAGAALAALSAVALAWLHPKMAVVSIAIAVCAWRVRSSRSWSVFLGVSTVGALHYGWFWWRIFGVPAVLGVYGGVPADATGSPAQAALGLLFDRAYGVLPVAPVFAVALVGAARVIARPEGAVGQRAARARLARLVSIDEAIMVIAVVAPILFWRMWWGGQCPPGRFLVPALPILALWVVRALEAAEPVFRRIAAATLIWSYGLFLFAALEPGRLLFLNRRQRPTRIWEALSPGGTLDSIFPDLARPLGSDWWIASLWSVVLIAVTVWGARGARAVMDPSDQRSR